MAEDITTLLVRYKQETTELKKAQALTDQLADEISRAEVDMDKLDKTQRKTYDSIVRNSKKAKTEQKGLTDSIKSMAAGYLSFHTIKQAVKQFADFDDALKRTQALTGATAMQSMELEKQARDLGATTAFTASQVAIAQGNMGQAGLKVNQILEATPGILALASAGQVDLASATDMSISALNIFGLEASKATHVADLLATAQANSTGNTQWFAMAIQNAGANAKTLGYTLEDTLAILGAMAPAFKEGGSAGTSLNAILRDLNKNMNRQGQIMLNGKKVTIAQNGEMLSMSQIIANVDKATKNLTKTQKYQALATVLGDEAIRGFNVLLGAGADEITRYDNIMDSATGTAKKMSDIMESGIGGALRETGSAIESVALQLVTTFEPAIMIVLDAFSGFLTNTSKILEVINNSDALQSVAAGFLTAAGAVKVLTGAMTLLGIASSATPLGAIAAIAGLVVAGGTYLYKKFNKPEETATNNVPKYALGTNDAKGGLSLVGERGPELVNIPQGSQVVPTEKTKELLSQRNTVSGDNINITINSTGADIDDIIDKLTDFFDQRERRSIARTRIMLGGA
nr:MAG TPA: minor tail protein [Caudoviricetes sp.]